ncbi:unnamed protein product, partial [marine sediment metagenome]
MTEIKKWESEMDVAMVAAAMTEESSGGAEFISTKSGVLSYRGEPVKDNTMAVIALDFVIENAHYAGRYDPSNLSPPDCFAFGGDIGTMAPHKNVVKPYNDKCGIEKQSGCCPNNEYGTSDLGKGKACKNLRRLAIIPAGDLVDGKFEPFETKDYKT